MSAPPAATIPPCAHRHGLVVSPEDIDELGHVNNVRWLRFVIDAAVAHSTAVGLDFAAYARLGVIWVVRRHELDYLRPATLGEALAAFTWVESMGSSSSIRRTRIVRDHDHLTLFTAATTWVMIDRDGRPTLVPPEIRGRFEPVRPRPGGAEASDVAPAR